MIFPTPQQVRKLRLNSKEKRLLHYYPVTHEEITKVKNYDTYNPLKVIDHNTSFRHALNELNSIFGTFISQSEDSKSIIVRGKLDFYKKTIDPETGEKQCIFTISNPRALYDKKSNDIPCYIRVPESSNLLSGLYAKVKISKNDIGKGGYVFVKREQIEYFDVLFSLPNLFMDYSKFSDIFKVDYYFDMGETTEKLRENLEFNNLDRMLLNKLAGENYKGDVKGAVNFNLIKYAKDQNTYEIGILDEFLNKVTISQKTQTVYNFNDVDSGSLPKFLEKINNKNRKLSVTPFKNYYGGNVGYSLQKYSSKELEKFLQGLKKSCVDYINPIGTLRTMHTRSSIKKLLNQNENYYYGSKILFLETQLLPVGINLSKIGYQNPRILRMSSIIKKMATYIHQLGSDEVMKPLKITENDIDLAKRYMEMNKRDVEKFVEYGSF